MAETEDVIFRLSFATLGQRMIAPFACSGNLISRQRKSNNYAPSMEVVMYVKFFRFLNTILIAFHSLS